MGLIALFATRSRGDVRTSLDWKGHAQSPTDYAAFWRRMGMPTSGGADLTGSLLNGKALRRPIAYARGVRVRTRPNMAGSWGSGAGSLRSLIRIATLPAKVVVAANNSRRELREMSPEKERFRDPSLGNPCDRSGSLACRFYAIVIGRADFQRIPTTHRRTHRCPHPCAPRKGTCGAGPG